MQDTEKKAFIFSLALHAGAILLVILVALFSWLFRPRKEKPVVFELVSVPVSTVAETPSPNTVTEPVAPVEKEPRPAPSPTVAQTSTPEPEPLEQPSPKPATHPQPAPEPSPAPIPRPKPAPPPEPKAKPVETISAADFFERYGKPDTPKVSRPKPAIKPVQKVHVEKIDIGEMTADLSAIALDSASQNKKQAMSSAGQAALQEYIAGIRQRINIAWRKQASQPRALLEAKAEFMVAADGSISFIRFVRRSGDALFDDSVRQAIEQAGQALPTPDNQSYTLSLVFRLTD